MRRFIKQVIIFILPILFFGLTLEIVLRKIPNDYIYKCNFLNKNSDSLDILFLGNSHIYYGINPAYVKCKSFNASYISQSLNLDLEILNKYKNNWRHLKYLVVPVDYFTLFSNLETGIEAWRIKDYSIYYGIHSFNNNFSDRSELLSNKFEINLFRIFTYYFNKTSNITCDEFGWGFSYNSKIKNNLEVTGKEAAERHLAKNDELYNKNTKILKDIIEFAREKHIKVLLVASPTYKTYFQSLNKSQLRQTVDAVSKLEKENDNVVYLNLINDNRFNENEFFDADHLNDIGAKKFTLIVDSLIGCK